MAASINLPFFASSHLFQPKMWMKCANVNNALLAQPAHQIQMRTLKNYILRDISMIAWSVWIECKPIWFKLNRTLDHYFPARLLLVSLLSSRRWIDILCIINLLLISIGIQVTYVAIIHPENKAKQDVCLWWEENWDCKSISSWGQNITQHPLTSQQRSEITH